MKNKNIVSFMNVYKCVLNCFLLDDDKYTINVLYDNNSFNINIYNETKKINAFYKSMILSLEDSKFLKNCIRYDFINNYDIYLPYIYNYYEEKFHIIKNHKFILSINVLDNELDDLYKIQNKALKKMVKRSIY